ncbi:hypothetical protein GGR57DRAFT_472179 [Xylariaceae sp. FL1272]|nr:hypothetical protein GGR57DRAFT_472179 [Xylariaceae sp. FL1272]
MISSRRICSSSRPLTPFIYQSQLAPRFASVSGNNPFLRTCLPPCAKHATCILQPPQLWRTAPRLALLPLINEAPSRPLSAPRLHSSPRAAQVSAICLVDLSQSRVAGNEEHLLSQTVSALYLIPLVVAAVILYEFGIVSSPPLSSSQSQDQEIRLGEDSDEMAALPGRPGNLTSEEEEKLRKFWEMFLQVCGVYEEEGADNEGSIPFASQGKQATAGSEKPKKKRLGLFKKKKGKENGGSEKEAVETPKSNDSEDKWGESKAYHETLAKHSPEAIRATIWSMVKHDNPDALLLRFLRARKWDLQRALVMMISSMNWRLSEMHVDDEVMVKGEEHQLSQEKSSDEDTKKHASDFLAQMRLGKSYNYGIDKTGRPICICRARLHKAGEHSEQSLERYTVYLIETTRFLLEPPTDTGCVIFDLTGFSLANMDYTPVKFMIRCFEANYPESLGIVLVHKAPWVFQGIWKIIRGWLDPVVANKVNFTNNVKDLEAFIDVDKLPTELEGTSGWSYRYVEPLAGENGKMKDTETRDRLLKEREAIYEEYESKTIEWLNEADASKRNSINAERSSIAKKLKEQYWQLDPYIRSRSLYDRVGMLKPGGKVDYYSSWETPAEKPVDVSVPPTNGGPPATASADDDID